MPTYRDLQLQPHIQSNASSKDEMSGQGDGLTTHFHIIGAMAKEMDLQLSSMGKQQKQKSHRQMI